MTTALDLITDALNRIGVYAAGETISDADAEQALTTLNDMLDGWSNQSLACYAVQEQSFPMVAGVSAYTIGPGGTFNGTRPLKILDAPGRCYFQDENLINYALNVVDQTQWNLIAPRNIESTFPDTLFYDPQYPLGIINIYPVPLASYTLFFDAYLQLADLGSLTATMSLPPGYARAIKANLAVELWTYFKDGQPTPIHMRAAMSSLADVKRTNTRSQTARVAPGLGAGAHSWTNIYTDTAS
ncbi:MAG: hypothetical protein M0Z28_09555 [Rhodospirillales bacterium]|nr:hypothetical protein [Rhodospirillales bacterium]